MKVRIGTQFIDSEGIPWSVIDIWTGGVTLRTLDEGITLVSLQELAAEFHHSKDQGAVS